MLEPRLVEEVARELGRENVFSEAADLHTCSYDAAVLEPVLPALVLRSTTSRALSKTVRL